MDLTPPISASKAGVAAAGASTTSAYRHRLLLEVCVDTTQGLAAALANGADRIELCSALSVGGLTPSLGLMHQAARLAGRTRTPVVAMVRPRAGDFVYTEEEIKAMIADIRAAWDAGMAGVVVGVSRPDGALDERALAVLVAAARHMATGITLCANHNPAQPFTVTLHRAIDLTPDPVAAVEAAVRLGIDRILTSGGAITTVEGRAVIQRMVEQAAGRVAIMAGSGVNASNVAELIAATGIREVHASCSGVGEPTSVDGVVVRATALGFMDGGKGGGRVTDGAKVRELAAVVHGME